MQPALLSPFPQRINTFEVPHRVAGSIHLQPLAAAQGIIRPTARYASLEIPQERLGAFQPVPQASKSRRRGFMIRELIEQGKGELEIPSEDVSVCEPSRKKA